MKGRHSDIGKQPPAAWAGVELIFSQEGDYKLPATRLTVRGNADQTVLASNSRWKY